MLAIELNSFSEILTERLKLKWLDDELCEPIFKLHANLEVAKFLDRHLYKSKTEAQAFIAKINGGIATKKWIYWAIFLENKFIGTICLWNFSANNKICEIGYELFPEFSKQGFMNEAVSKIIKIGFEELKLSEIQAYTHHENTASTRLLISNGFQKSEIQSANPYEVIFTKYFENK